MTAPAGVPASLLTPSGAELDDARARIGRLAGDSADGALFALGLEASGAAGRIIRAMRHGDLEAAARGLRQLAAVDLAAAERRAGRPVTVVCAGGRPGDPAIGGLDEEIDRGRDVAGDLAVPVRTRDYAAGWADGAERALYVVTGRPIAAGGVR
ncbi:hypothetical protein CcI49_06815 [Frankia sp. CcI49]|uniref:hypothetical protein n=1 Tax=Frankia sp. CcI49 TaxID=1745382 RepID=UPI000975D622|nr:hypothetical protein [Frankia sp. CcI49]ONH61295.1 hypothetical protein CcI49_06815 [Frankia sp. CcI49]